MRINSRLVGGAIMASLCTIHFGGGQSQITLELAPGTHTLQLDFGDARHMQFDLPRAPKPITIHVI